MHLPTACRSYSLEERKEKLCCLCACCLVTRVITGKIVEDEAIYDPQRFLVEDFLLLVIKPPGTYFNNELLLLADSSFPATSVLLRAPLDPIRSDKHCIESCEEPLHFLIHSVLF